MIETQTLSSGAKVTFVTDEKAVKPVLENAQQIRDALADIQRDPWEALRPIGMRALVRRDPPVNKIGLIYISDEDSTEGQFATVLALGHGNDFEGKPVEGRFPFKVGDRVCLFKHGGTHVPPHLGDELTYVVEVSDVLGLVADEQGDSGRQFSGSVEHS